MGGFLGKALAFVIAGLFVPVLFGWLVGSLIAYAIAPSITLEILWFGFLMFICISIGKRAEGYVRFSLMLSTGIFGLFVFILLTNIFGWKAELLDDLSKFIDGPVKWSM
jgi:hypothetical protein